MFKIGRIWKQDVSFCAQRVEGFKADISISSVKIHCVSDPGWKVFFHLDNSVEESQDKQFAGRVQCDRDTLRAGHVKLHLSRLTAQDSGKYLCRMVPEAGKKEVQEFSLHVTSESTRGCHMLL